jgi:superfamily I DNA and/or RNA helicase
MSAVIEAYYHTWESELTLLRTDDLLVNIDFNRVVGEPAALWDGTTIAQSILKETRKIKREQGIDALVLTTGVLEWQKGQKKLQTPVFLHEALSFQAEQKNLEFAEQAELNPFVKLYLKNEWQLEAPDNPGVEWIESLIQKGVFESYTPATYIGNFHPQRYELRREWEALKTQTEFSTALLQVLGDFDQEIAQNFKPFEGGISPLDPDQKKALELASGTSCVIYGPPGTGKSAVLSNFLAQLIFEQKKALVVSEKRGALEVLKHRLTEVGLGQYCLVAPNKNELKSFYQQLQTDFQALLHAAAIPSPTHLNKSTKAQKYWQERHELEHETKRSFSALQDYFGKKRIVKNAPTERWKHWLENQVYQQQIPSELIDILPLLGKAWTEKEAHLLENEWQEWQDLLAELKNDFALHSTKDLAEIAKKSLICQQFQTQVFQKYAKQIFSQQQGLEKNLTQFLQKEKKLAHLEENLSAWLQIPSKEEFPLLKARSEETGYFKKRQWRKIAQQWLRLPELSLGQFEKDLKQYWQLKAQVQQNQLRLEGLGLENKQQDLPILLQLLKQINWEQLSWYQGLSSSECSLYVSKQTKIYRLASLNREFFQTTDLPLTELQVQISNVFETLSANLDKLQPIPFELWSTLRQDHEVAETLKDEFWAYLRMQYPLLYQWDHQMFRLEIEATLKQKQTTLQLFQEEVQQRQIDKFQELEYLLTTPIRKLNEVQKNARQNLRKGKSILVKEMAKTRQFSSLKTLLEGPAADWLFAIYPVWLLSPALVASSLPMQRSLFDFGLFDEASQLPLSHAIGALQRVETALIAGDPEQMSPSSYFSAQADGVIDLLHQAAFHLPGQLLRYHYRSEHPSLIAFSNQHFYKNELQTWPSTSNNQTAIFQHFVADGQYLERQNINEAQALAKDLSKLLKQNDKIGVVAFSVQQLHCIYTQLSQKDQAILEDKINQRQAFFLALEQIQGEECDHLLISFGFGKNDNNEFNLRFGPMNQAQGSKRLNVLLTRARKSLHFYCSVKAADFPAKRSESVDLIYRWFLFLEDPQLQTKSHDPHEILANARDFDTYLHCYRVLKQRLSLPNLV